MFCHCRISVGSGVSEGGDWGKGLEISPQWMSSYSKGPVVPLMWLQATSSSNMLEKEIRAPFMSNIYNTINNVMFKTMLTAPNIYHYTPKCK